MKLNLALGLVKPGEGKAWRRAAIRLEQLLIQTASNSPNETVDRMMSDKTWSSIASSITVLAVIALALMHIFDMATPKIDLAVLSAIVVSGTAAWLIQAKQPCPGCGKLYGYRFRFMHARICRNCGAEFNL